MLLLGEQKGKSPTLIVYRLIYYNFLIYSLNCSASLASGERSFVYFKTAGANSVLFKPTCNLVHTHSYTRCLFSKPDGFERAPSEWQSQQC